MRRLLICVMLLGLIIFPSLTGAQEDEELAALTERLMTTPIIGNTDTPEVAAIFEQGQALGNRAQVFTKVGDSNTTSGDFLLPIGMRGDFCRLGEYAHLQTTIDYFSAVSPREGADNSFNTYSIAAANGLSTAAALDPFWSDANQCERGESPLECEYRITRPAVSIIMLGLMDARYGDSESYRENLEEIVQVTIAHGVIPVLTTFVVLPTQEVLSYPESLRMNDATLDIAEAYQIPYINLWQAAQALPDMGIGPDRTHLSHAVGEFCAFDGAQHLYGGTLRNLLTLQTLEALRHNVLAPETD